MQRKRSRQRGVSFTGLLLEIARYRGVIITNHEMMKLPAAHV